MIESLLLTLGLHFSVPADNQFESSQGYEIEVGTHWLYGWGSYDDPDLAKLGQQMGEVEMIGFGLGTRLQINDKLSLVVEYGRMSVETNPDDNIRNEIIRAQLHHDHGEPPFNPQVFSYKLEDDYVLRLGAVWMLTDHVELHADYRWLRVTERLNMWEGDCGRFPVPAGCVGWHQENNTLNLSAVEVGLAWRF